MDYREATRGNEHGQFIMLCRSFKSGSTGRLGSIGRSGSIGTLGRFGSTHKLGRLGLTGKLESMSGLGSLDASLDVGSEIVKVNLVIVGRCVIGIAVALAPVVIV